ncbi:MAG: hypothetical protein ACWIPH_09180, partial [Ostreibacterium sp.]
QQCKGWSSVVDIADYPEGTIFEIPSNSNFLLRYRQPDRVNEYFLIEATRFDRFHSKQPDEGLLIWHIDKSQKGEFQIGVPVRKVEFSNNTRERHFTVGLEQADGKYGMETIPSEQGGIGDAFRAGYVDKFGETTVPNSKWWDGTASGLEISEISAVGKTMSFKLGSKNVPAVKRVVFKPGNCKPKCQKLQTGKFFDEQ